MRGNTVLITAALIFAVGCGRGKSPGIAQSPSSLAPAKDVSCDYHFKRVNLCASLKWEKIPTLDADGSFRLTFTKSSSNQPVDPGYSLNVVKRMPGMACPPATLTLNETYREDRSVAEGIYDAKVSLEGMPGKSEIWIRLITKDAVVDEARVTYTF